MAPLMKPRQVAEIMLSWIESDGDVELVSCTNLQTLWAGYGHICAVTARVRNWGANGSLPTEVDGTLRLILKLISPPSSQGDEGHLRKMLSYEVEQYFYRDVAPRLQSDVAVAKCLASTGEHAADMPRAEELRGLTATLMTDLRPAFPVAGEKRSVLTERQVQAALDWLAKFHAGSWALLPDDLGLFVLPPLEEARQRTREPYRDARTTKLWLNGGYTYLATRRKEFASLSGDASSSEWGSALCDPVDGGASMAEMVADFLTPSGRSFETYIHGDVKSENLFTTEPGNRVAFFDFQYVGLGLGVCDLAKLFTCSIPLEMLTEMAVYDVQGEMLMGAGEQALLEGYWQILLESRPPGKGPAEYDWHTFVRHWESALVDWCRFQASWGFWGNTEWLEARVRSILADQGWRAWLKRELRKPREEEERTVQIPN